MTKQTTTERHERNAASVANYVAGFTDKAPVIRRAGDLIALGTCAEIYGQAEQARVNQLQGGIRALGVATVLALAYIEPETNTKGGQIASAKTVVSYMKAQGYNFGGKSAAAMASQVTRVADAAMKKFAPSDHSKNETVIAEALGYVRTMLAEHGTFTAWIEASPKMTNRGAKAKAEKDAPEAETAEGEAPSLATPEAAHKAAMAAILALQEMAATLGENNAAFTALMDIQNAATLAFEKAEKAQDGKARKRKAA